MSEFALAIGILWALFFSSMTIAVALAIAWANFGHPRYALSWALAFGMNAAQVLVSVAAVLAGGSSSLTMLAFALMLVPGPLFAAGVRQRAGLADRRRHYAAFAVLALLFVIVGQRIPALAPFADPAATLFSALVLMDAAAILRPRTPKPEAAEWALACATALLAGMELIVAILNCAYTATGDDPRIGTIYHGMLAVAVPPAVVACGVSAILVVASDLAVQLRRLAARDPLTGLYNRRGFNELAIETIARAHSNRQPVSIVLCDIDHFKRINDDHGHAAGDQTLVHVGRRLSAGLRAGDLVGRIGGEEFALLVLDSRGHEAALAMDRIRAGIAEGLLIGADRSTVSASFGVAEVGMEGTIDTMLTDAFDQADRALYRSKIDGRDRVTLAGVERTDDHLAIAHDLDD